MCRCGFANIMLTELIAADLFLLTICQVMLVWHCHEWRKERPQILDNMNLKANDLTEILTEFGHLLADIGDLLENAPQPPGSTGPSSGGFPELILSSLLNRTTMPPVDGTSEEGPGREIHEEELGSPQE